MNKKKLIITISLLLLLMIPLGASSAAQGYDRIIKDGDTVHEDVVIFGGSLLIEEGAFVDGDVSVFGGSALMNGTIDGDVVIFGGEATLNGDVYGDLVIFGGRLQAQQSADVDGDCILIGGSVSGDGSSQAGCSEVGEFPEFVLPGFFEPPSSPSEPGVPDVPRVPDRPVKNVSHGSNFFGTISSVAGWSLLNGILALVIASVAPNHLKQVGHAMKRKPVAGGVVGFLSMIAIPSIAVILAIISAILTFVCIGLLGWPILLVIIVGFALALLLGWVAAGNLLGQRLAIWLKLKNQSLPVTAAFGTAVLTLAAGLLSALPFWLGGWFWTILAFLVLCTGLGAVTLTRFGSRSYPMAFSDNSDKVDAIMETMVVDDVEDLPPK